MILFTRSRSYPSSVAASVILVEADLHEHADYQYPGVLRESQYCTVVRLRPYSVLRLAKLCFSMEDEKSCLEFRCPVFCMRASSKGEHVKASKRKTYFWVLRGGVVNGLPTTTRSIYVPQVSMVYRYIYFDQSVFLFSFMFGVQRQAGGAP